jgi:hypothetical protein
MPQCELPASQLCDLLNFVLSRPIRGKNKHILFERISVCVVDSWVSKRQRRPVLQWCEQQLVLAGALPTMPRRPGAPGRPQGVCVPKVIARFTVEQEGFRKV